MPSRLLCVTKKLEASGIKLDSPYRVLPNGLAITFLTDPWGLQWSSVPWLDKQEGQERFTTRGIRIFEINERGPRVTDGPFSIQPICLEQGIVVSPMTFLLQLYHCGRKCAKV